MKTNFDLHPYYIGRTLVITASRCLKGRQWKDDVMLKIRKIFIQNQQNVNFQGFEWYVFFEIYGFQITWKDWTKQSSSIIKLIFYYQCKFAIFSIVQRENEVSLRSRLLTFFWAAQQYDSYFFHDSATDFLSVPAI